MSECIGPDCLPQQPAISSFDDDFWTAELPEASSLSPSWPAEEVTTSYFYQESSSSVSVAESTSAEASLTFAESTTWQPEQTPEAESTISPWTPEAGTTTTQMSAPSPTKESIMRVTATRIVAPTTTRLQSNSVLFLSVRTDTNTVLQLPSGVATSRFIAPSARVITSSTSSQPQVSLLPEQQSQAQEGKNFTFPWYAIVAIVVGSLLLFSGLYKCCIMKRRKRAVPLPSSPIKPYMTKPTISSPSPAQWNWQPPASPEKQAYLSEKPYSTFADTHASFLNCDTVSTLSRYSTAPNDRFSTVKEPEPEVSVDSLSPTSAKDPSLSWYANFDENADNPFESLSSPASLHPSSPYRIGQPNLRIPSSVYTRDSYGGNTQGYPSGVPSHRETLAFENAEALRPTKQVKVEEAVGQAL